MTLKKNTAPSAYIILYIHIIIHISNIRILYRVIEIFYYAPNRHTVIVRGRRAGRWLRAAVTRTQVDFWLFLIFFTTQREFEARRSANKNKPVLDGFFFCISSFVSFTQYSSCLSPPIYNIRASDGKLKSYAHIYMNMVIWMGALKGVGWPNHGMTKTCPFYTFISYVYT